MATLAVDTCLAACSACVLREDGESFARTEVIGTGHAERIAPMVAELLAEAEVSPAELARIACTVGPGSFMGARVGVSLAKGLALPRGVPCVPVTTLQAIALGTNGTVCVLIDARRGQAYVQRFEDGRAASEPELRPHDEVVSAGEARGVGLVAMMPRNAPPDTFPDPEAMARAAGALPAAPLRPFYLRAPDAKPPARAPL